MNKISQKLFDDILSEKDSNLISQLPGPIFIYGVSGFIGSQLFITIRKRRKDVYGFSKSLTKNWRIRAIATYFSDCENNLLNADVTDSTNLRKGFEQLLPKTVINLSAYGAYERESDAQRIHEVNYIGVSNLLKLCEEFPVVSFVNTGSSSEYGLNCSAPLETSELIPNSDYAVAKVGASKLVQFYGIMKNVPCNHLRLYSVFGPWEDRERFLPKVIQTGLQGQFPFFAEKDISRDFIYVDDCVRAILYSTIYGCKQNPGACYNIGTGTKKTIADVALFSKKEFSISTEPQFASFPKRKWDLKNWYSNPEKASKELGWKSLISFEEGMRLFTNWEREVFNQGLSFLQNQPRPKKLSAIIACYKDHLAIPIMYERLTNVFTSLCVDYEIIFVNDCSPTNDGEVIKQITANDTKVMGISHSRNFGSQSAFISGMTKSNSDAVILLDGDLQDPPELIAKFYQKWLEGFDVVYGVRERREAPFYMQLAYKLFYRIFRHLSDITVPVDAGDFSLIDHKVVIQILKLNEKDLFLRGLRAWVGFKQTGIPYVRPERMFGVSTNNFLKNFWWAKKGIFSFSSKPLEYIQRAGFFMFLVGILMTLFYFYISLTSRVQAPRGIPTIIILVTMLGSIQLLSLSVLGEYIGKILEEVKSRPKFIVNKILKNGMEEDSK